MTGLRRRPSPILDAWAHQPDSLGTTSTPLSSQGLRSPAPREPPRRGVPRTSAWERRRPNRAPPRDTQRQESCSSQRSDTSFADVVGRSVTLAASTRCDGSSTACDQAEGTCPPGGATCGDTPGASRETQCAGEVQPLIAHGPALLRSVPRPAWTDTSAARVRRRDYGLLQLARADSLRNFTVNTRKEVSVGVSQCLGANRFLARIYCSRNIENAKAFMADALGEILHDLPRGGGVVQFSGPGRS